MENILLKKLSSYKRKLYLNQVVKGTILSIILLVGITYVGSLLEFGFQFDSSSRAFLFFFLLISFLGVFSYWVIYPCLHLFKIFPTISDEKASVEIGKYFPEINDKLLNTMQLWNTEKSDLAFASIDKRIDELKVVPFVNAIDFRVNWKYARILIGIVLVVFISSLSFPKVFVDSAKRIVDYNTEYVPVAPFEFRLLDESLTAFRNEDYTLSVEVVGESLPENVFIAINNRAVKLEKVSEDRFQYFFIKPYQNIDFQLNAAGFESLQYSLTVLARPEIRSFNIELEYPPHTKRENETVSNSGNLNIPEGTTANWLVSAENAEDVWIQTSEDTLVSSREGNLFRMKKRFIADDRYELRSRNEFSVNKDQLLYEVQVAKDEFPQITNEYYADTVLFEYVVVAGSISDDYGVQHLELVASNNGDQKRIKIPFSGKDNAQTYYYKWDLDSLSLKENSQLQLYLEVTDNDAINGFKKTRSPAFIFKVPSKEAMRNEIASKSQKAESGLDESIKEAKSLNEKIQELENRLKSKKEVEWQEERLLEEILNQREKLEAEIEKLKEDFENLNEKENKYTDKSEDLQKKAKEIQELMKEVLDEETKKLYDELQKLLEEQGSSEEIQDKLNQMSPNEKNLEEELERMLELFKRLKVETKLEQTTNDLKELAQEQEELSEKTQDKQSDISEIKEEQQEIKEKFEKIKEELDAVEELNQELDRPEPLSDFTNDEESIEESLEESEENLKKEQKKESSESQKKSSEAMKKMSEKMEQMKAGMEMEMIQENLDDLRQIVDNLVKLSFKEEDLIFNFRGVQQVDPRFVELSQEQLKLKDDAEVIQDSLMSLAGRVTQISSFVTREVGEMNRNIDIALKELKNRNRGKALSTQQYAMASMNNLSLLLADVLEQMQEAMANQSGTGKPKPGDQSMGNLKKLQQQIGQQIKELKESGQQGRKLSEQLAKMAAQQEMIRNQLREFEKQLKGQPNGEELGNSLSEIMKKMEQNEVDLVNKRLTDQLVQRQKEIETRMLEAEESLRDQDFDKKREGETAGEYDREVPEVFEEYLKAKEREIELLKNVPLELSPFYKKEVNDYFRRLSRDY